MMMAFKGSFKFKLKTLTHTTAEDPHTPHGPRYLDQGKKIRNDKKQKHPILNEQKNRKAAL